MTHTYCLMHITVSLECSTIAFLHRSHLPAMRGPHASARDIHASLASNSCFQLILKPHACIPGIHLMLPTRACIPGFHSLPPPLASISLTFDLPPRLPGPANIHSFHPTGQHASLSPYNLSCFHPFGV